MEDIEEGNLTKNPMHQDKGTEKDFKTKTTERLEQFQKEHPVLVQRLITIFGVFTSLLFYYDLYTDIIVNVTLREKAHTTWVTLSTIFLVLPYALVWISLMVAGYFRVFPYLWGFTYDLVERTKNTLIMFWTFGLYIFDIILTFVLERLIE